MIDNEKIVSDWFLSKRESRAWQERERELRSQVIDIFFPDPPSSGTTNIELSDGSTLRLKTSQSIKVDDIVMLRKRLSELTPIIAERLVSWKPSVSIREYKLLSNSALRKINACIVIRDDSPQLEIVLKGE